jgi:hypothetical protein
MIQVNEIPRLHLGNLLDEFISATCLTSWAAAVALSAWPLLRCWPVGTSGNITTYTLGPDTLSINASTDAFDNYFATPNFDLDFSYIGAPDNYFGIFLTDPGVSKLAIANSAVLRAQSTSLLPPTSSLPTLASVGLVDRVKVLRGPF